MEPSKRAARGILAIWNDCAKGREAEYETWYRGEHLPERVSIPGFRAAWRFRAIEARPEYFSFYETDTPEVLFSEAYHQRVEAPTALTTKVMTGIFLNATRTPCTQAIRWGVLRGAVAVVVRYDARPGGELEAALREIATRADVLRAELWLPTREQAPGALSAEQALRGPDQTIAAGALVETLTEHEAAAVVHKLRGALGAQPHIGTYRLFCSLHREDLDA